MRKLSIVIPVLDRLELLENSLVSVLQNRPSHCELIVVLNQPYDDPYELCDEVRFLQARPGAGWSESVNLGIAESQGAVVHVLACGVEVAEGWTEAALRHFQNPRIAAVAPLVLDAGRQRIVCSGVAYGLGGDKRQVGHGKSFSTTEKLAAACLGPDLLAGFYRTSILELLAGFDALLGDDLADVDLALQFTRLGLQAVCEPGSLVFAPSPAHGHKASFSHGRAAQRLFLRHTPQDRWLAAMVAHGLTVLGEFICTLPHPAAATQLLGRALAWCEFLAQRQQARRLAGIRAQLEAQATTSSGAVPPMHRACTATTSARTGVVSAGS